MIPPLPVAACILQHSQSELDRLHLSNFHELCSGVGRSNEHAAMLAQECQDPNAGFSELLCKMVPQLKERLTEQLLKKQTASM